MSDVKDQKQTNVIMAHATDVHQFLSDLNGGVFEQKLGLALSDVAAGVVDHGATGEVTIKFKMKRIGDSASVAVSHELAQTRPTDKGSRSETNKTSTPMHVDVGGKMMLYPMGADSKDMFKE